MCMISSPGRRIVFIGSSSFYSLAFDCGKGHLSHGFVNFRPEAEGRRVGKKFQLNWSMLCSPVHVAASVYKTLFERKKLLIDSNLCWGPSLWLILRFHLEPHSFTDMEIRMVGFCFGRRCGLWLQKLRN